MAAPGISTFLEPYVAVLLTILLAYLAIKLLGDTVVDVVKFLMQEIKGAFTGQIVYFLNVIIMLLLLSACFSLFVPGPVRRLQILSKAKGLFARTSVLLPRLAAVLENCA